MPILTKDQVLEAKMELEVEERDEVIERVQAQGSISLELSEEQKQIIRTEIEAHRNDSTTTISREQLMTIMRADL